jgi:hypothetical protein
MIVIGIRTQIAIPFNTLTNHYGFEGFLPAHGVTVKLLKPLELIAGQLMLSSVNVKLRGEQV